jgi:CRP-like cAMP-binding protein/tRNA A-37 threonylcarbamoyl transferase component Bud32
MTRFCPHCDDRLDDDVRTCPRDGSQTFLVSTADPMIGRKIDGRFTITGLLGSGGMGIVYRALQHSIQRDVALKLLRPENLSDEDAIRRFFREARAASRLTNPHTITVFDFGQSADGQFYIAMELLRGRPLSTLAETEARPMDPVRAVGLVDQILEALEEAHREGVLHRDLKTDNVFVLDQPPNFLKVMDFGLAKVARLDDSVITQAGTTFGTPAFMSPEQAGGKELDARSDLYSVGAILFELLAGRLPFDETSAIALILRKLKEPAPTVAAVAPGVSLPPALDAALASLLAIDPARRPASATQARRILSAAVGRDATPQASAPQPARSARSPAPAPLSPLPTPHDTVCDPGPRLASKTRARAVTMLTQALGLAAESAAFYEQAVRQCTSASGRNLFTSLAAEEQATAGLLRRACESAGRGESAWGGAPAVDRTRDPAGKFEESVRASVSSIRADAHLGQALDAGLIQERRVVDFWVRQSLDEGADLDSAFLQRRLAEAKDHVASLAEVKLRVLGLMRGAGFNSLYMRLAGQLPVSHVRAGETLFHEGAPGDSMVVIVSGRFRLEIQMRPGRPTLLAEIGPGEVVGEMTCLDPAPRGASVIAMSDAEVCVVDRGTLAALRETDPGTYVAVIRAVISQVAERVRETDKRIEALVREVGRQPSGAPEVSRAPAPGRAGTASGFDPRRPTRSGCFNANDLKVLGQVARSRSVKGGTWICREGETGDACFVLTSGNLEIVRHAGRDELILATLAEGSVVGQIGLVDGGPRSASVRALGDCELLELDRPTFDRLVDAHVPLALRFQEQMAVTGIRQLRLADRWLSRLVQRREEMAEIPAPAPAAKAVTYMRTALREWGMSMEDLDQVTVVVPAGMVSAAEVAARRGRFD